MHSRRAGRIYGSGLRPPPASSRPTPSCATSVAPSSPGPTASADDIRIGAAFPLSSNAGALARQELAGVEAAADFVNADGGVDGRRITLAVQDLDRGADAPAVMRTLKAKGVIAVVGAYSSDLSIPASQAASNTGLVYWEAGAVADRLTGRGLPLVFRVGASGANLGSNSAAFAVSQLAPRLARTPAALRIAVVAADDDYARSVADAAAATARADGAPVVARLTYDLVLPDWPGVISRLSAARPDVIVLASHIPDGVAFRRAMIDANLHAGALIGSTMAECDPDFAGDLGQAAVGVFASDRPTGHSQPTALDSSARALYDQFAATWTEPAGAAATVPNRPGCHRHRTRRQRRAQPITRSAGRSKPALLRRDRARRACPASRPGWALFHDVLPIAASSGTFNSARDRGSRPQPGPPDGNAAQWRRAPVLHRSGDARTERARGRGDLAVAGRPDVCVRLATDIRDWPDFVRAAGPMTTSALGRPGQLSRSALISAGLAVAVWLRWAATVSGTADALVVGFAFGLGLLGVAAVGGWRPRLANAPSLVTGIAGAIVLVVLALATRAGPFISLAPAAPFGPWALVTILVACTEEAVLRGALFTELDARFGVAAAVLATSIVFALVHVPLYGWHVVPLDLGVGLWLAGLRLASGGVAAPAVAHTLADLATWWL